MARRALAQCTDVITESSIDPFTLARRLYAKEVISESIYKKMRNKKTGDSSKDRLELILDNIKDRITHNASILISFISTLNEMTRQDLAVSIVKKYKGMLYRMLFYMY